MRVWMWPAASSASRSAPMRPSIMSEGATTSAPASACDRPCLHERRDRHVVHHVTGLVDDAVLAVGGERIERDVGDHAEFRHGLLDRTHGTLGQAIGVPGFAAVEALGLGRRDREEGERRDAEARDGFGFADQLVHRHALDARHRRDRHALLRAFHDEHRDR